MIKLSNFQKIILSFSFLMISKTIFASDELPPIKKPVIFPISANLQEIDQAKDDLDENNQIEVAIKSRAFNGQIYTLKMLKEKNQYFIIRCISGWSLMIKKDGGSSWKYITTEVDRKEAS